MGKHILPNAEFLISAGDQSDSSKTDIAIEEYYEFRSPDELKNIPVAVNKGNHDTVKEIYEEQFMPPGVWDDANYYFARDGVLFFALNSNSGSYATQIEYLKRRFKIQIRNGLLLLCIIQCLAQDRIQMRKKY